MVLKNTDLANNNNQSWTKKCLLSFFPLIRKKPLLQRKVTCSPPPPPPPTHQNKQICRKFPGLLCSPPRSRWFSILGETFSYVTIFFNPAIEVVTFHLCGRCMLGEFLLLTAFICLGHEHQDLLSLMACMCAQTRPGFILSSERVFGEWSQSPC